MNEENKIPETPSVEETPKTETPAQTVVVEDKQEDVKYMTQREYEQAKLRQSLPMGILAGFIVAVACAGAWAWFTLSTDSWYAFMGVIVGIAVGFSVRFAGRAVEAKFGIIAAFFALLGCALGNFFWGVGIMTEGSTQSYFNILFNMDFSRITHIMKEAYAPIDIVFYILAPIAGFGTGYHTVKIKD